MLNYSDSKTIQFTCNIQEKMTIVINISVLYLFVISILQEHQNFWAYAEISVISDSMLVYDRKLT